jgi:hypothetical protein
VFRHREVASGVDAHDPPRARARRARLARVGGIAAALVLLATPGVAAAGTIGAIGINDLRSDGILLPNEAWSGLGDLDMAAAGGVQLYRARVQLNCVDPGYTGSFNFTSPSASCGGVSYDQLVEALAQRGMTLLPVLINYTNGSPLPPTVDGAGGSPTIAEFAAFAAAAVERYGPTGTFWPTCACTPHPIEAWEIWNEENNGFWWAGDVSPTGYAQVFAATRDALRSVDPQALAVVGGLAFDANGQPSFVEPPAMIQALAAGNANAFDAVAIHPYTDATGASSTQMADQTMALVNQTAAAVRKYTGPGPDGAPRQQLWLTEVGWSTQFADPNTVAAALQDFFGLLQGGGRAADNVGPVLWYDLRNNSTLVTRDDSLGLRLTAANGADAGAQPAWNVFTAAAQQLGSIALPPALSNRGPYKGPLAPPGKTAGRSGHGKGKHAGSRKHHHHHHHGHRARARVT